MQYQDVEPGWNQIHFRNEDGEPRFRNSSIFKMSSGGAKGDRESA